MKNILADITEILIIVVAVAALVWVFLAEPLEVTGESMLPTLHDKEQVLVEKASLKFGTINRGDIVVINSPQKENVLVIKRVIALQGDTFEISDNTVYVNGNAISEDYINDGQTQGKNFIQENETISVPYESIIVLGDNRENSTDSRDFGPIKLTEVVGKAKYVYYPFDSMRKINPEE